MVIESLTGALLDDLDDLSDVDEERAETVTQQNDDGNVEFKSGNELESSFSSNIRNPPLQKIRLIDDPKLKRHLESIDLHLSSTDRNGGEDDDRYHLMTTSNKFLAAVEDEVHKAHMDLVATYKSKFPELEDLLPNPVSYKNAVKVIQNEMDLTRVNDELTSEANLTANQIITLSIASSTTQGEPLSPSELQRVNDCISYMESVLSIKNKLISFIEKHMDDVAPNMCTLIGPTLAARMVAAAGGIAELSKIPACNLQVLGQAKATSTSRGGMSTSISSAAAISGAGGNIRLSKPHEGMLSECDLYNKVPSHLQRKALKLIAAKLALAIRCDYVNLQAGRQRSNESGRKFREEIEKKFAKLEEPDLAPVIKPLPK
jgi:U4/U6 small nuclear ribonucleoprotein PRP31